MAPLAEDIRSQGKDIIVVGVMKGGIIFVADLLRKMPEYQLALISVSSYGSGKKKVLKWHMDLDDKKEVVGKHLLLVDDICDTGTTLAILKENFMRRGALSVQTCVVRQKKIYILPRLRGFRLSQRPFCGGVWNGLRWSVPWLARHHGNVIWQPMQYKCK